MANAPEADSVPIIFKTHGENGPNIILRELTTTLSIISGKRFAKTPITIPTPDAINKGRVPVSLNTNPFITPSS